MSVPTTKTVKALIAHTTASLENKTVRKASADDLAVAGATAALQRYALPIAEERDAERTRADTAEAQVVRLKAALLLVHETAGILLDRGHALHCEVWDCSCGHTRLQKAVEATKELLR